MIQFVKKNKVLVLCIGLVVYLLIPVILPKNKTAPLSGPNLKQLKYSEVTYYNEIDSIHLAAMLFMPEKIVVEKLVILIQGSGSSRRSNKWYLGLAQQLQMAGIAVLLPDKRGCEKSEGNWVGTRLEDLGNDILAAIDYVSSQATFANYEFGLIGMSQGGWISPIVVSKSSQVKFIINMSTTMTNAADQLYYEEVHNIDPYTWTYIARGIAKISTKFIQRKDHYKPFIGFDPMLYWYQISIPTFIAYGGGDKNVPIQKSLSIIQELSSSSISNKIYQDGGHAIRDTKTNEINPTFIEDLIYFIRYKTFN